MDLAAEIERLASRRDALANEIGAIDQQLERVRLALGFGPGERMRPEPKAPRPMKVGESTRDEIMRALAHVEPQRADMLAKQIGSSTVKQALTVLAREGALIRRASINGVHAHSGGYWYARTAEAFNGHPDTDPSNTDQSATDADEVG